MTIADQIVFSKRRARQTTNAVTTTYTDDVVRKYVNDGVREFCKKTNGITAEEYLTVQPTFNLRTNFAIRLTITGGSNALAATDIIVSASSQDRISGTDVATLLETAIQAAGAASATVSWSSTEWIFTIDAVDSTSITLAEPSGITYVDATSMLFGSTGTKTGTTYEGSFPEDCTVRTSLPSNYSEVHYVEWDGVQLKEAPFDLFMSPESFGDPTQYNIKEGYIYLTPVPSEQKELFIRYNKIPTDATLTGSSDTTECSLNSNYHMAPVYYAAAMLLDETFEFDESSRNLSRFYDQVNDYKMKRSNENPKMFPAVSTFRVPRVDND